MEEKLIAMAPVLLSGSSLASGNITIDAISNVTIVAVAWYFYKRTEAKNELMEGKMEKKEERHQRELKEQQDKFIEMIERQETKAEQREADLFNKLIESLQNKD